jgi:hypothetical protein
MAKLTARFDLQDRISKKLKTISDNTKKLEKSRDQLNRPITLRVRDQATRKLNRVHRFVLKDIAKTHTMFVKLRDQATRPLNRINTFVKRRMPRTHDLIVRAQDRTRTVLERIRRYAGRHLSVPYMLMVAARDRATPVLHKIANYARRALSKGYNFSVRAIDIATKTVGRIASFARTAIPRYRDFTIRAWDRASRIIGTVRRALFSIPTMITVTLAVVGLGNLTSATIGSAMNFEGYEVAMQHWLDGNKKQADELVQWMGQFADSTPFSSVELFPALSRGIGVTDGNIADAKQLLTIASNMAALTPNRTVEDAMEALASAQMGEFELLKGYNMKITADDYDDMGWSGFLDLMDSRFEDGAKKFSQTASGQLATLRGYTSSIFREAGVGILESMKPRLDAITTWLDNNQETWGRWKDTVQQAGLDASEWLFSKLENGFSHIRTNYLENDDFKNLDFEGKVKFIMDDLGEWWNKTGRPLMADVSKDVGEAIFKGVTWGIKEGIKGIGSMWADAFKNPSVEGFAGAGIATAIAGSILSLVLTPLFRGISGIFKTGKWFWDQGKKVGGLFSKGKGKPPVVPPGGKTPTTPTSGGKGGGWFSRLFGRNKQPDYRNPWFDRGAKPVLNVPNAATKAPKIPKALTKIGNFGKRIPVLGTLLSGLALATAPKEEKAGVAGGIGGGMAGAAAGAAIGSVVPVIGTTIGGILGGILGSIGGSAIGDWFSDNWSSIKEGASDAASWVSDKFNTAKDAIGSTLFSSDWWLGHWDSVKNWTSDKWDSTVEIWDGVKDTISSTIFSSDWWLGHWESVKGFATSTFLSANWWAEQAGFVWGYLESTIFSGDWWSEQWSKVQELTEGTIFDGAWWTDKWNAVMEWTSEKWDSAVEIWESVKTAFAETVFSSDWWLGHWESVKGWTQEKWDSAVVVWESITTALSDTVFNSGWWLEKWEGVKGWTQEKWDSAVTIWNSITDKISETVFSSEWWGGKWESVKGWTQDKWDTFTSVWNSAKEKINETLFSKDWWSGKWETVKGWATTAWEGIKSMASGLGESFNVGRDRGQSAAEHANGGFITRPHLGLVGEAGPEAIIPLSPNRRDRAMSLYEKTGQLLGVKPYAYGGIVGAATATLPQEQVTTVISVVKGDSGKGGSGRDIIVQITGDNYYNDEMDAEKVADIAVDAIEKKLKEEYDEGGELVVYE